MLSVNIVFDVPELGDPVTWTREQPCLAASHQRHAPAALERAGDQRLDVWSAFDHHPALGRTRQLHHLEQVVAQRAKDGERPGVLERSVIRVQVLTDALQILAQRLAILVAERVVGFDLAIGLVDERVDLRAPRRFGGEALRVQVEIQAHHGVRRMLRDQATGGVDGAHAPLLTPQAAASSAALTSASARAFSARGTERICQRSNPRRAEIACSYSGLIDGCLTLYAPVSWRATSSESLPISISRAPSAAARSSPRSSARYSATLLVATPIGSATSSSTSPLVSDTTMPIPAGPG